MIGDILLAMMVGLPASADHLSLCLHTRNVPRAWGTIPRRQAFYRPAALMISSITSSNMRSLRSASPVRVDFAERCNAKSTNVVNGRHFY